MLIIKCNVKVKFKKKNKWVGRRQQMLVVYVWVKYSLKQHVGVNIYQFFVSSIIVFFNGVMKNCYMNIKNNRKKVKTG